MQTQISPSIFLTLQDTALIISKVSLLLNIEDNKAIQVQYSNSSSRNIAQLQKIKDEINARKNYQSLLVMFVERLVQVKENQYSRDDFERLVRAAEALK